MSSVTSKVMVHVLLVLYPSFVEVIWQGDWEEEVPEPSYWMVSSLTELDWERRERPIGMKQRPIRKNVPMTLLELGNGDGRLWG